MKTFFIIIALLGGIFGGLGYANVDFNTSKTLSTATTPQVTYEIKQIYMPRLNCKVNLEKTGAQDLDKHARMCFDVHPEHIKMTMPSI